VGSQLDVIDLTGGNRKVTLAKATPGKDPGFTGSAIGDRPNKQWCLFHEDEITCPQGQALQIYSAFYNRVKEDDCRNPVPVKDKTKKCKPGVTEEVAARCDGQRACEFKPTEPPACPENPFQRIRVVWDCVPASGLASTLASVSAVARAATTPLPEAKTQVLVNCMRSTIEAALVQMEDRLKLYTEGCKAVNNGTLVDDCGSVAIIDTAKICSAHCQAQEALALAMADVTHLFVGTTDACREEARMARLKRLTQLVQTLDKSWGDCKEQLEECEQLVATAEAPFKQRLAIYTGRCGVPETDLTGDVDVQPASSDKVCDKGCQEVVELSETLEAPDFATLKDKCALEASEARLVQLQELVVRVEGLDAAWQNCDDGSDDACPDHSMVSHVCGSHDINQEDCTALGCCWDPPKVDREQRRSCYKRRKQLTKKCAYTCPSKGDPRFPLSAREDCAKFQLVHTDKRDSKNDTVRGEACLDSGCCWSPLTEKSPQPWCFHVPCLLDD